MRGKGIAFLFLGCSLFSTLWDNLVPCLHPDSSLMGYKFRNGGEHLFEVSGVRPLRVAHAGWRLAPSA